MWAETTSTLPVRSSSPKAMRTAPPTRSTMRRRPSHPGQQVGHPAEGQAAEQERDAQAQRIGQQEGDPSGGRAPGAGGQGEDTAQHRPDAGGPGEGEGHPHDGRGPGPEDRRPDAEPLLAGQGHGQGDTGGHGHQDGSEHHDQDARDHLERVLVGEEEPAQRRGRGAEDGEDHRESGDEGQDPPEQAGAVPPELLRVRCVTRGLPDAGGSRRDGIARPRAPSRYPGRGPRRRNRSDGGRTTR